MNLNIEIAVGRGQVASTDFAVDEKVPVKFAAQNVPLVK